MKPHQTALLRDNLSVTLGGGGGGEGGGVVDGTAAIFFAGIPGKKYVRSQISLASRMRFPCAQRDGQSPDDEEILEKRRRIKTSSKSKSASRLGD